jgi:hypothetical protein
LSYTRLHSAKKLQVRARQATASSSPDFPDSEEFVAAIDLAITQLDKELARLASIPRPKLRD